MNPEVLIDSLRKTDMYIEKIFLNGGCYQFYLFLKTIYQEAEPYFTEDKLHIVTKIKDKFYDITGVVNGEYLLLTEQDKEMCKYWSFWKYNFLYKECPNCGEQIKA